MADLKKLKLIRSQCNATLTRIENYVNDPINLASTTVDLLAARKEKLMWALKQYESVQLDILSEDDKDTEDVGQFEERYFTVLAKINETIKVISKTESFQTTCVSSSKLPTVEIPTFDGKDFTKFKPFYDLFIAVIDNNNSLTDVQKLFYLRKYLLDEALAIIINLPLINKLYREALQLLEKRYHDPTRLIFGHLDIVLDMPSMQKCTASGLRALISNLNQQLHALKNLEEPVEHWDHIIICVIYKKIDPYTKRAFNLERDVSKVPTLKEFINFLEKRAMALEDTVPFKINSKSAMQVANVSSQAQSLCKFCDKKEHAIFKCPKFKMVPIETRLSFVKDNKLCSTCLRAHGDNVCKYNFKCKVCKSSHNSLLHSEDKKEESPVSLLSNDNNASPCNVLLPTVMVKVSDKYGRDIQVRALLDSGSQASFVTNSLVNKLGLTPTLQETNIIGVGNRATKLNKVVSFCINSCQHENIKFNINCHIVEKITTPLPQQFIDITKLNIPKEILLSDNNFNIPLEISILLGADIYFNSLLNSCFKILDGPTLQNTVFGYVVAGRVSVCNQTLCYNMVSNMAICDENKLENVMEKFWLSESFPEPVAMVSDEFQRAEASFKQSVQLKDNTFYVDLPLITPKNELQLGDSFSVAWQRFLSLERKLKQNHALFVQYKEFIDLYVAMGHAKEVDINSYDINCGSVYFLAHHAVFNEESKTTKFRTVFDGGMQSKNKISLNDVMLKEPVVQETMLKEAASLILKHTATSRRHLTPELALRLITPDCPLWRATEEEVPFKDPFWAFYWPGGQATARFILDNSDLVKNRKVLDVGCGCGAGSIAAAKMRAKKVVANDIDDYAVTATEINANLNDVTFETSTANLVGDRCTEFDTILIGDMFYDEEFANLLFKWLHTLSEDGKTVLIGDPGRHGLTARRKHSMTLLAKYRLPEHSCMENNGFTHSTVWQLNK